MLKLFETDIDVEKKIENLRKEIERYSYYYYTKNQSLISDIEFDKMLKELEELEKRYPQFKKEISPTKKVGAIDLKESKFKKVVHKKPMLSLSNSYNIEDMKALAKYYRGHDYMQVKGNVFTRTFPLYLEDDTNANPTGGICEIQYKLVDGEACRILKPVKYTIYNIVDEKVMK